MEVTKKIFVGLIFLILNSCITKNNFFKSAENNEEIFIAISNYGNNRIINIKKIDTTFMITYINESIIDTTFYLSLNDINYYQILFKNIMANKLKSNSELNKNYVHNITNINVYKINKKFKSKYLKDISIKNYFDINIYLKENKLPTFKEIIIPQQ